MQVTVLALLSLWFRQCQSSCTMLTNFNAQRYNVYNAALYDMCAHLLCMQVTVLALLSLWFRQLREAEVSKIDGALTLPEKHHLLEALQRLPISFGMAMRVRYVYTL
jgi:hypothetical protein